MINHPEHWGIEEIRDIDSLNAYEEVKKQYDADPLWLKKAMKGIQWIGRDNVRLRVQWDSSANTGFTTGNPWIRVYDNSNSSTPHTNRKNRAAP
jgi:oligo-1,6-glucosidase